MFHKHTLPKIRHLQGKIHSYRLQWNRLQGFTPISYQTVQDSSLQNIPKKPPSQWNLNGATRDRHVVVPLTDGIDELTRREPHISWWTRDPGLADSELWKTSHLRFRNCWSIGPWGAPVGLGEGFGECCRLFLSLDAMFGSWNLLNYVLMVNSVHDYRLSSGVCSTWKRASGHFRAM